jgi:hypothetical protein
LPVEILGIRVKAGLFTTDYQPDSTNNMPQCSKIQNSKAQLLRHALPFID